MEFIACQGRESVLEGHLHGLHATPAIAGWSDAGEFILSAVYHLHGPCVHFCMLHEMVAS